MSKIKFYSRNEVPVEMHKVKIVQKLELLPARERLEKMEEAGFNTFLLHNGDIFMDMLTDSGVNAMSDNMQAAMLRADDAYAGSETFYRMNDKLTEIFGIKHLLPAHQGRACEHILAQHFVKPGNCIIMNYHFTTSKAHVTRLGGRVEELVRDEGLEAKSDLPFKGNIDLDKVKACIAKEGADNIAYMRLEAGTNLIGGQPISYENMKAATEIAKANGIPTILDASLLQDNLYFIKTREESMKDKSIAEITRMIADLFDIIYFSARKFGFGRGGGILVRDEKLFHEMEDYITMFEGFLTYGGMSVKEMEALIIGFEETMDLDVISQGPQFINHCPCGCTNGAVRGILYGKCGIVNKVNVAVRTLSVKNFINKLLYAGKPYPARRTFATGLGQAQLNVSGLGLQRAKTDVKAFKATDKLLTLP